MVEDEGEPSATHTRLLASLGGGPKQLTDPFRRALVVGGKGDADMAIIHEAIVGAIGVVELIQRLSHQQSANLIACQVRQRGLVELQPSHGRKFIEHLEKGTVRFLRKVFGEGTALLIEQQADEGTRAAE